MPHAVDSNVNHTRYHQSRGDALDHIPTTPAEVDAAAALMSLPTFGSNRDSLHHPCKSNWNNGGDSVPSQARVPSTSTAATSTTTAGGGNYAMDTGAPKYSFACDDPRVPTSSSFRNVCYNSDSSLSDVSYGVEPPTRDRSRSPPSSVFAGSHATNNEALGPRFTFGEIAPNPHYTQQQPALSYRKRSDSNSSLSSCGAASSNSSLSSCGGNSNYDERIGHRHDRIQATATARTSHNARSSRSNTNNSGCHEQIEVELTNDTHPYGQRSPYPNQIPTHIAQTDAGNKVNNIDNNTTNLRFAFNDDTTRTATQQSPYRRNRNGYASSDSSISSYGHLEKAMASAYLSPATTTNNNNNNSKNHSAPPPLQPQAQKADADGFPCSANNNDVDTNTARFAFAEQESGPNSFRKNLKPTGSYRRASGGSSCDSSIASNTSSGMFYNSNYTDHTNDDNVLMTALQSSDTDWSKGTTSLALPGDEEVLSPLHCFMRKYAVEAFSAEADDVARPRYGKAHATRVVIGQVGIRCLHCKHRHVRERPERAVCYPSSLRNIYHSIETWQRKHSVVCTDMPQRVQEQLEGLIESSRASAGGRRQYWEESAKTLGMVDTGCGIRFARPPGLLAADSDLADPNRVGGDDVSVQPSVQTRYQAPPSRPIVCTEDTSLVSGFLYTLMFQMETCNFSEEDRSGNRSKVKEIPEGYPGMQCKHCRGKAGLGRYFPSSVDALALANSDRNICNHVMKCRRCPDDTQDELRQLQQVQLDGKQRQKRGSRKQFFSHIWKRIHGNS